MKLDDLIKPNEYHRIEGLESLVNLESGTLKDQQESTERIFEFAKDQVERAKQTGDTRPEWSALIQLIGVNEKLCDETPELSAVFLLGCQMGCNLGLLSAVPRPIENLIFKASSKGLKQHMPLMIQNAMTEGMTEAAQTIALELWKGDKAKAIRLGEMCELVWNTFTEIDGLFELYGEVLPDRPQGLRNSLRGVAPAYARRGGRPKKT